MKINYKIELLSDWHCGSGLDSGSEADALAIKDEDGLPYIPGKTIKGLLRDSLEEMNDVLNGTYTEDIGSGFGREIKENGKAVRTEPGALYFSNAELEDVERKEIISNILTSGLFRNIASTAINKKGVAKVGSLRVTEVCMPVVLHGSIESPAEFDTDPLTKAFKWTRYLGVGRNRGLGRCKFIQIKN